MVAKKQNKKKLGGGKGNVHESGISQASVVRDFKKKIDKLKNKKVSDADLLKMCNEFKESIEKLTDNTSSIGTNLSKGNVHIGKVLGAEKKRLSDPLLKPDKEAKLKLIAENKEIYLERLQNRILIDYETYLNAIDEFKKSENYDELIVCVSLATGRRMTEICKTGEFKKQDDKKFVIFSGQLKKKDLTDKPYEIPIIGLDSDELRDVMKRLRAQKDWSKDDNEKVASLTNKRPNDIFKALFGANVTSEIIRGAYAFIAYRSQKNHLVSEVYYGANILGHKDGDLSTFAMNYMKVYVNMPTNNGDFTDLNKKMDKLIGLFEKFLKQNKK